MRAFTLLLMLAVAGTGILGGYQLITGEALVDPGGLGIVGVVGAASPTATAIATSTPAPTPTLAPAPEPPPEPPTPTPIPDTPQAMLVGNTEGLGVYLRRTPNMADRLRAWPDRTRMEILGRITGQDGLEWMKVRAPDGAEGYVPERYLVSP